MNVTNPGKSTSPKGGRTVFTEAQEIEIARRAREESHSALSIELGVHRNTIRNIIARVAQRQSEAA